MPDSFTPNLNFTLPEVGSSSDTWGTKNNANWTAIDAKFLGPGKPLVVVMTGSNGNAKAQSYDLDRSDNVAALVNYYRSAKLRWWLGWEASAENGSNAGSNFGLWRFDDVGTTLLGNPILVERATGKVTLETTPYVGSNQVFHAGNAANLAEPVGTVKMWAGTGDPAGGYYLVCDGRSLSRAAFPLLFGAIGTIYGAVDGASFNIPDCGERVIIGKSAVQSHVPQYDCRALGNSFGEANHMLLAAELAAHTHPITDPKHHHGIQPNPSGGFQAQSGGGGLASVTTGATVNTTDSLTGITQADSAGGNVPHNNVQPALVLNFIIRVQ
jgi:microcystin-dependent protein